MEHSSTVDRIKAVAMTAFGEKGYTDTSLAYIAEQVGIKKPSLYAHFKNKDELFLATVDDLVAVFTQKMQKIFDEHKDASAPNQLKQFLFQLCFALQENNFGQMYRRLIMFPPSHLQIFVKERFLTSEELSDRLLTSIFEQGIAEGTMRDEKIDRYINSFYCLADGLFIQRFYYDQERYSTKIKDAWNVFWLGIKKE
ncbi:TetR/AcrR family transcriptional regulator [Priestia flexa]|jgi:TetR/AcrR family transcriptional regulator, biofilm operon repressor|uniref:TetR/AcrR family transcriptional regulator n=2 Tax=Priestia flexa TaxID=86664 RepID=A0A1N6RFS1_9BACI|nr:TetR/AcrR family transcriptional regulator [Priestia flexa]AQX55634.1 TetR family transcriptional regulator [Priestia flexa]MBN8250930.1 TetR/AcrR family transcriptional regulator [Priestia flexa]MBN8433148.1 TetR/AcrR family transcriptional regulator [Priestia flexa]MBY6086044.1 TetR/AcrR family transcriptional regulator [Priestia flexa]MCA0965675.1 TetR/AcrR family transcriptional regulator [Priestia flexa]